MKLIILIACSALLLVASPAGAQGNLRNVPDPDPMRQLQALHVADGFEINLFAAEPMIAKPIQMNWDEHGRLWVAGSTAYPQLKPGQRPDDKIFVLEDTNGDGVADRSTVFAEGLLMPTGIVPGDGGVYVANSTELVHLMDTTGDGKADQRRVILSGFGTADTHHLIHTFRWGPDGLLYFNQAIYIYSHVETPHGIRRLHGSGIWQFRPETMELEIYARGLVNPWGLQFDRFGQTFATDGAGGEGINLMIPDGTYLSTPGAERILRGLNTSQPKYSGLGRVSGRHMPESWEGSLITNDFRANRVNRFSITEQGSGFAATLEDVLIWTDHVAFRPVDVITGPDGALYVADWYNPIIQHGEVDFRDPRRDQQHGRIWRITAKDRALVKPAQLAGASVESLLDALLLPEDWTRDQARRLLKERGAEAVMPALDRWAADIDRTAAEAEAHLLEALWVSKAVRHLRVDLLRELLAARDHRVRAAAVRMLYSEHPFFPDAVALLERASSDAHPMVRREAVGVLQHFKTPEAAKIALGVLDHEMDDYLDFALWHTIRELAPAWLVRLRAEPDYFGDSRKTAFALKSAREVEAISQLVQLYDAGEVPEDYQQDVLDAVARHGLPPELDVIFNRALATEDEEQCVAYLQVLERAAQQTRRAEHAPERIAVLLDSDAENVRSHAARIAGLWQIESLRPTLTGIAQDGAHPDAVRRAAIEGLARMGDTASTDALIGLAAADQPPDLRIMVATTLPTVDVRTAARVAADVLQDTPESTDPAPLFRAFFSQRHGVEALSEVLIGRTIPAAAAQSGVRTINSRPMHERNTDAAIAMREALEASGGTLPPERMPQRQNSQQINALEREVRARADVHRGEEIYRRPTLLCMNCHAIGGAGGIAGPDLTTIGTSAQTDYLIEKLLDPERAVKDGYALMQVVKRDGSIAMGTLIQETSSEVVLRDAADQEVRVPVSQIERQEIMSGSLMPPGLTAQLEREEFIDLVGFLSQLGEASGIRLPPRPMARRWRVLQSTDAAVARLAEQGESLAAPGNQDLLWRPAYSLVSGDLPLEALPEIVHDSRRFSFARFELDVTTAGTVRLGINDPEGLLFQVGAHRIAPYGNAVELDLPAGTQEITVIIDRSLRTEAPLRIELLDDPDQRAGVQFVAGK